MLNYQKGEALNAASRKRFYLTKTPLERAALSYLAPSLCVIFDKAMKLENAVAILGSLAQPTRLMVFRLLVLAADRGMCAGDISTELNVSKPALSFHLKELANAGLIESTREGRSITYRLQRQKVRDVVSFLTDDCGADSLSGTTGVKSDADNGSSMGTPGGF
ncbi:MAG: metalloregulator ArsR/SmtB family transcription factor [Verrucomicrobiales bacterium]|nr:metalloregulator ArsR/SmtB family transcription factor [Verrucomicrobiales bacterium]